MMTATRTLLLRQFDTAWSLTTYHLGGLQDAECLWQPAATGPHVHQLSDGSWNADWPEHERYDLGPASIAWLTWHIGFWWSMTLNHSFGDGTLRREDIRWPGSAAGADAWIRALQAEWRAALEHMSDDDLQSTARTKWPIQDRPFANVAAWANLELMKNAAEIGYARFLYGVR